MKFTLTKGKDKIEVEILDDGRIKTSTDGISAPNHDNADKFLKEIAMAMGGKVEKQRKRGGIGHSHVHSHNGVTHEH